MSNGYWIASESVDVYKTEHLSYYPIWEVEEGLEQNLNISDAQLKGVVQNVQRSWDLMSQTLWEMKSMHRLHVEVPCWWFVVCQLSVGLSHNSKNNKIHILYHCASTLPPTTHNNCSFSINFAWHLKLGKPQCSAVARFKASSKSGVATVMLALKPLQSPVSQL